MNNAAYLAASLRALFPAGLQGLIFDCDGVLVDSKAANIGYYNRLLAEFGHPPMPESLENAIQMGTVLQAFTCLFTEKELQALPSVLARVPYSTFSLPLLHLEPGLQELLVWLRAQKIHLAVHTNRNRKGIADLLAYFSLQDFFDPVMTAEDAAPKPDPAGVQAILAAWKISGRDAGFIGDSPTDAGAASGAGVRFFAYRNPDPEAALHLASFDLLRHALQDHNIQ